MTAIRFPALLALACALAVPAAAQTLYKLTDKNGKVTYSEKVPPGFDGKVTRMDIDPKQNTATLPKPGAESAPISPEAQLIRKSVQDSRRLEERVQRAKEALEEAQRALQDLIDNPGEKDVTHIGKAGGGARPIFSESYQDRVGKAAAAVKAAEEELKRAESGTP